MSPPRATIAVLSIGQMGLGISNLLRAHNYRVITNVSDRSPATQDRARSASIELVDTDEELVTCADYVLSIVPPRDAVATAKRVEDALSRVKKEEEEEEEEEKGNEKKEVYYLDLNAISPATVKRIQASFQQNTPHVRFIDGGIIGGPPTPSSSSVSPASKWIKPGIPLSGPHALHDAPISGAHLADVLNSRYLGEDVGSASGLKCCFAALSKGFTALALQSFTTASELNVLEPLRDYLDVYNPGAKEKAAKSIVGCTGKAYRWVEEMNQIGECFAEEGGWRERASVFREIAGVFEGLADVVEGKGMEGMRDVEGVVGVLGEELKGRERA